MTERVASCGFAGLRACGLAGFGGAGSVEMEGWNNGIQWASEGSELAHSLAQLR